MVGVRLSPVSAPWLIVPLLGIAVPLDVTLSATVETGTGFWSCVRPWRREASAGKGSMALLATYLALDQGLLGWPGHFLGLGETADQ